MSFACRSVWLEPAEILVAMTLQLEFACFVLCPLKCYMLIILVKKKCQRHYQLQHANKTESSSEQK